MKKTLILLILTGITFLSCSDNLDNNIVSIPTETDNFTTSKMILSDTEDLTNPMLPRDSRGDRTTSNMDLKKLSVSKLINGVTGGFFMIDTTYVNYQGRLLYVHAEITVLQNAFQGTTEITMILNPEEASIQFFPHMVFDTEVRISVEFMGIDLKALDYKQNGNVDFAFFDDDGSTEIIQVKQSHVNVRTKTIKVLNAKLYHFSRYGWLR